MGGGARKQQPATPLPALAVTGGMGSGKSSVSRFLAELSGALLVDADGVCRELLQPEAPGWLALRKTFGERFFRPDRQLDRPLLRKALFADAVLRHALDALLHPLARLEIARRVQEAPAEIMPLRAVVEVPLLFEAGWEKDFASVVVVYAGPDVCLDRLMARDALSRKEAEEALAAQLPLREKIGRADHVIDNSGPWSETCSQILRLKELVWSEK